MEMIHLFKDEDVNDPDIITTMHLLRAVQKLKKIFVLLLIITNIIFIIGLTCGSSKETEKLLKRNGPEIAKLSSQIAKISEAKDDCTHAVEEEKTALEDKLTALLNIPAEIANLRERFEKYENLSTATNERVLNIIQRTEKLVSANRTQEENSNMFPYCNESTANGNLNEKGCMGLEGGAKYLISDNGYNLARCYNCDVQYLGSQTVGVHGEHGQSHSMWSFEPVGDKCALKSDYNNYASRSPSKNQCQIMTSAGDRLFNNAKIANASLPCTLWTVERYGNSIALKGDNGMYITRCKGCVPGAAKDSMAFVNANTLVDRALWKVECV